MSATGSTIPRQSGPKREETRDRWGQILVEILSVKEDGGSEETKYPETSLTGGCDTTT